jgi:hypothetical protein
VRKHGERRGSLRRGVHKLEKEAKENVTQEHRREEKSKRTVRGLQSPRILKTVHLAMQNSGALLYSAVSSAPQHASVARNETRTDGHTALGSTKPRFCQRNFHPVFGHDFAVFK